MDSCLYFSIRFEVGGEKIFKNSLVLKVKKDLTGQVVIYLAVNIIKGKIGVVANYRRGRHTQNTKHILLNFNLSYNEAAQLIGKVVEWTSPAGKILTGKIVALHGKNGVVRAIFQKGLPGEAIGQQVKIR